MALPRLSGLVSTSLESLRPLAGRARRLYADLYWTRTFMLLLAERPSFRPTPYTVIERTGDVSAVTETYREMLRSIEPVQVERRFAHGLRYFELRRDAETIATTFIVSRGTRFIDELGLHFAVPENSIWLRDVFVSPRFRGHRVFEQLFDELLHAVFPGVTTIWSDTTSTNAASLRAHAKYGFREVGSLRALIFLRTLMWRFSPNGLASPCDGYQVQRRFLWLGSGFRDYCERHLA